ncbi:MAG: PhnD/SsuA/transferrin family substrate-binding protein [Ilumatobacteraceae bacterium]
MRRDSEADRPPQQVVANLAAVTDVAATFSSMAMYPYESLRSSWDDLYGMVARGVTGAPNELRWDLDVHDTWLSPQLVLGMTCGWPLVNQLQRRVRVVGTFVYAVDGEVSHTYRSVIIARQAATVADLTDRTLAFNSTDSLSGYVSMISLLPAGQSAWAGPTLETGGHLLSIDAVRDGCADIASIDALAWTYTQREAPETLQGLVIIDRGPLVPHLPLITNIATTDESLGAWRTAFAETIRNPAMATTLDRLMIQGFVALDVADYETALSPLRRVSM